MSEQNTLDKILENTEVVKEVVVTRENEKQKAKDEKSTKRKEQLKTAQKKFVHIKASVKPELQERIIEKAQDGNVSAYILKLIDEDINPTQNMFEALADAPDKKETDLAEINELKEENQKLKDELNAYQNMTFGKKIKFLFS